VTQRSISQPVRRRSIGQCVQHRQRGLFLNKRGTASFAC